MLRNIDRLKQLYDLNARKSLIQSGSQDQKIRLKGPKCRFEGPKRVSVKTLEYPSLALSQLYRRDLSKFANTCGPKLPLVVLILMFRYCFTLTLDSDFGKYYK